MKIGDMVVLNVKVRDLVGEHVLTVHEPSGKEYWFHRSHVETAAAGETPAESAPQEPQPEEMAGFEAAVAHAMAKGYDRPRAEAIVKQLGPAAVLALAEDIEPPAAAAAAEIPSEG